MKRVPSLAFLFLSAVAIATSMAQSAAARPTVPFSMILLNVGGQGDYVGAELVVPDTNTTVSAGNGLRHYDVHIAKMFEVTHHECLTAQRNDYELVGYYWRYRAGGGDINMGNFPISCRLAQDIVSAYGLGAAEPTEIMYYRVDDTVNVPTLNIVGSKAEQWGNFTRNFSPQ